MKTGNHVASPFMTEGEKKRENEKEKEKGLNLPI